jgi:hypothetical protein
MALVASDLAALGDWSRGGNDLRNLLVYAGAGCFGLAVYAAASYLLGSRELSQITSLLRPRAHAP